MLVVVRMPRFSRTFALAAAATVLAAAPAEAGRVTVVDGKRAVRVNDPDVPTKAEIALPAPGRAGVAAGVASAARARARRSAKPRADRRAVYRALTRAQRSKRISK